MDAAQWPQQVLESSPKLQLQAEKRVRPFKEQALNCPRCSSTNTKFCYYNNYSLSQPRYFCKTCRRYWTEGGSLRNVPVGGGSRKNKRPSSSSSSSNSAATASMPTELIPAPAIASTKFYNQGCQDLNLSFSTQSLGQYELGELLRSGIPARGLGPSPEAGSVFGGFGFQELMRQSTGKLPFNHHHGGYSGSIQQVQEGGTGRPLFPFEDLRLVQMSNGDHGGHDGEESGAVQEANPTLFWNGGNGGGATWS